MSNTTAIWINVIADEDPSTRGIIVIKPANIVVVDAEIDQAIVNETETLVEDSFKGTVVHMECGFLYASNPRDDGSLTIDESRTKMVDEVEVRKHSCVETVQAIVAKACSDRINSKLKTSTCFPSAEIRVEIGKRLKLQAQLGDKRVELSEFTAHKHDAIIRLIGAIARLLCSIAVIFAGATNDDMFLFATGNLLGVICIAWLPEAAHSAIASVRTCKLTKKLLNQISTRLNELKPVSKNS